MNPKVVSLSNAVNKFENSERTVQDYLDLMIVVRHVLAPADGLSWGTIQDTLEHLIGSKHIVDFTI